MTPTESAANTDEGDPIASTVTILQPCFVPWRGVFRLIGRSDHFVFYDDVQYDKHGWRNRNRILDGNGLSWITIPVRGSTHVLLNRTEIDWNGNWVDKLMKRLVQVYAKRPHGALVVDLVRDSLAARPELICNLSIQLTTTVAGILFGEAAPKFHRSSELMIEGGQSERLALITKHLGGTVYLSGPSAFDYLDRPCFVENDIEVVWEDYEFPADHPTLDPAASILDYLAECWSESTQYVVAPQQRPPFARGSR